MTSILAHHTLNRRAFLRGAGVTLALPFLEAMLPRVATAATEAAKPRRMICIETNMGIMPQFFSRRKKGATLCSRRISKGSPHIARR